MFRRGSWLLCWLLVLAQSSFCERRADHSTLPPALRTDVRQLLEAAYANGEFSGIVAVRQHGRPLLEEVFGYADYENRTAFTSHTRFEIASLTKTFTAAAVLRLRDQHKLQLDDTLDRYLPGFPQSNLITVRQLLSHQSGVGELTMANSAEEKPLRSVVEAIAKEPFYFQPGRNDRYSNSGYVLLAAVIERIE